MLDCEPEAVKECLTVSLIDFVNDRVNCVNSVNCPSTTEISINRPIMLIVYLLLYFYDSTVL